MAIALFPFRKPITEATGCFGGMVIQMCTWSGMRCPSRIWHSFCWAKAWNTGPNCRRMFPKMVLRRLLSTNTTWYLQSHFEWALGSDTVLTLILSQGFHQATWGRILLPERSNLFESHWSNQWLTNFSYSHST